jgi:CBS domain-containing protein
LRPQLYRHLPIIAPDDGSLRGILTVRDLLQRAAGQLWEPIAHLWDKTPVEQVLKSVAGPDGADGGARLAQLYSIDSKQTIADAVVRMAKKTLNFLVAVDEQNGNEIQGVIMERHYVAYGAHTIEREKAGNKRNSTNEQIASIMTPRAEMLHAPAGMSGSKCLEIMVENNVRSVQPPRALRALARRLTPSPRAPRVHASKRHARAVSACARARALSHPSALHAPCAEQVHAGDKRRGHEAARHPLAA